MKWLKSFTSSAFGAMGTKERTLLSRIFCESDTGQVDNVEFCTGKAVEVVTLVWSVHSVFLSTMF